jgi:ParB-like chromosome segregation protein Spo0J
MRKRSQPYRILPPLAREEHTMLKASIEQHGVRDQIDVDEDGNILDGHERRAICRELGIPCRSRTASGLSEEGKRAYVLQANLGRRQVG